MRTFAVQTIIALMLFSSLKCCQFPKLAAIGFWLSGFNWQLLLCALTLHCQLAGFVSVHNFNSTVLGKYPQFVSLAFGVNSLVQGYFSGVAVNQLGSKQEFHSCKN